MDTKKRVALLGATGSIGSSALDVLREGKDRFETVLLSAHTDSARLLALGREFPRAALALSGTEPAPGGITYAGSGDLLRAIADSGAEIVVNGIAGAAGLMPSLAALEAGADLALANKETMVMAGPLVLALGNKKKARILPVDSEHAAVFNLTRAHGRENIREILLTASGGPFRGYSRERLARITPQEALVHPTWVMGPKITVDSATLANKGLEVIELVRLFNVEPERVKVAVHPQSIVHSMVRLRDGAVYAQLSRPDMRLPIHQALYWPETTSCSFGELSFDALSLEFEKPDLENFPMLSLAYEAARKGGLYPAAYNAANETAVAAFLAGRTGFLDISRIVEYVLNRDWNTPANGLEAILQADEKAREYAQSRITERRE
jgi:1-deoxy-D-xylulose-5-phosphate reductoisomerase